MKANHLYIFFFVSILLLSMPLTATVQQDYEAPLQYDGKNSPFLMLPSKSGIYAYYLGSVYNPFSDTYVIFYKEDTLYNQNFSSKVQVFSRVYKTDGEPDGAPYLLLDTIRAEFYWGSTAYNQDDDRILLVWTDLGSDRISAIHLNGEGKYFTSGEESDEAGKWIKIKERSRHDGAGYYPLSCWIPSAKRYAVAWGSNLFTEEPDCSLNGYWYAALNSKAKKAVQPKHVRIQTTYNNLCRVTGLMPYGDRILWGCIDDIHGLNEDLSRPMVFFTDSEGNMAAGKDTSSPSVIYPGPPVKGKGYVRAAYAPSSDVFCLVWDEADEVFWDHQKWSRSYYRIMDSSGNFTKGKRLVRSSKTGFQRESMVHYNSVDDIFTMFWIEYKALNKGKLVYFGGRLWKKGITTEGKTKQKAKALTRVFKQKDLYCLFKGYSFNDAKNEYLVLYSISYILEQLYELWGLFTSI